MHNVYSGAENALQMSEKNVKGIRKNGSIGDSLLVVRVKKKSKCESVLYNNIQPLKAANVHPFCIFNHNIAVK